MFIEGLRRFLIVEEACFKFGWNLYYSEIRCSVASKIAMLQCNVAIFMCKLFGANCNRFDKLPVDC